MSNTVKKALDSIDWDSVKGNMSAEEMKMIIAGLQLADKPGGCNCNPGCCAWGTGCH